MDDAHLSLSTSVLLTLRRGRLRAVADHRVDVRVRIQAPAAPAGHVAERPPRAVALVIERSVSPVQFVNRIRRLWLADNPANPC
jgi:hypothetical protein